MIELAAGISSNTEFNSDTKPEDMELVTNKEDLLISNLRYSIYDNLVDFEEHYQRTASELIPPYDIKEHLECIYGMILEDAERFLEESNYNMPALLTIVTDLVHKVAESTRHLNEHHPSRIALVRVNRWRLKMMGLAEI